MMLQYRITLFKNICLLVFLALGAITFFPVDYRVILLAVSVFPIIILVCAIILNLKIKLDRQTFEIYIFLLFWLSYSLVSLIWAKDTRAATEFTRNIMYYLIVFVAFSQLFFNPAYRAKAPLVFQVIFYAYCLLNMWEMITWSHLPSSRLYNIPLPIPTGFYFNENNSAVFLLLLSPFLTMKTRLTAGKAGRIVALIMFLIMVVTSAVQNSRLVLICSLILGIYYFVKAKTLIRVVAISIIIFSSIAFVATHPKEYKTAKLFFNQQLKVTSKEGKSYFMTSGKIRSNLNVESFKMLAETYLIGVGAGNYEDTMSRNRYHKTAWVIFAHNWWTEIMVNYGLIIALCMFLIYFRWLYILWRLRQTAFEEDFTFYNAYFISLLLFIPLSFIPSTIRSYYSVWVYFGLINAVCLTYSHSREVIAEHKPIEPNKPAFSY